MKVKVFRKQRTQMLVAAGTSLEADDKLMKANGRVLKGDSGLLEADGNLFFQ